VPFIHGSDLIDQIIKVTKLFGTNEVVKYIMQYHLSERKGHSKENICFDIIKAYKSGDMPISPPPDFRNEANRANCTPEASDLLKQMLHLDFVHLSLLRPNESPLRKRFAIPFLSQSDLYLDV
jgi:hypothetical protein